MALRARGGQRRLVPFAIRLRVARVRSWLAHRRVVRRALAAGVVVLLFGVVASARASVQQVEASWGESQEVLVVVETVEVGEMFAGSVETKRWPASVVPVDASLDAELLGDATATRQLQPGDVVTVRDVGGADVRALAEGRRALNVPTGSATPELLVGDQVELHVLSDHFDGEAGSARPTTPIDGVIIDVSEDSATVSVEHDVVVELAEAQRDQRLVVVRR